MEMRLGEAWGKLKYPSLPVLRRKFIGAAAALPVV